MPSAALEPLTCVTCRAPVPLGQSDEVTCPSCGGKQQLPAEYREFRAARQMSDEDAKQLDALFETIASPPPAWKRSAIVVGYAVGIVTLVVLAIGALVGAVAGFVGVAKMEMDGRLAMVLVAICAVVCGFVSVPFVGELLVFSIAQGNVGDATDLVLGPVSHLEIDLRLGGALYLFCIVPIAVARRTQIDLRSLDALRANLAAQPTLAGGVLGCRACGAPLTVRENAIAARCLYCETESLVRLSSDDVARQQAVTSSLSDGVREAIARHTATLAADRKQMWMMLMAGPLLAPLVALGGITLRALAAA